MTGSEVLRIRDAGHPTLGLGQQHTRSEDALTASSSHELLFKRRSKVALDLWIIELFNVRSAWERRQLRECVEVRLPDQANNGIGHRRRRFREIHGLQAIAIRLEG